MHQYKYLKINKVLGKKKEKKKKDCVDFHQITNLLAINFMTKKS